MKQTESGKSFEYAVLRAFYDRLSQVQPVVLIDNPALSKAERYYGTLAPAHAKNLNIAAGAAYRHILRLEPCLEYPESNTPLELSLQGDSAGKIGDVRDFLMVRRKNKWEIGISCKHNHKALKHSRLSKTLDFGAEWLGHHCSPQYFDEIRPIFERLEAEKAIGEVWENIPEKNTDIYIPILTAFSNELERIVERSPDIPRLFAQYMVGKNDFYKVISNEQNRTTSIQAMNTRGALNKASGVYRSHTKLQRLKLPERIIEVAFKRNNGTTIIVTCDRGWAFSMRIHSASKTVEPSLKFDVQFEGVPPGMYNAIEPWGD